MTQFVHFSFREKVSFFIAVFLIIGHYGLMPVSVFAQTSPSLSIQSINPGSTITPGNSVYFTVVPTGFGSAVSYTLSDSFAGTSISNNNLNNSSGVFAWIPTTSDAGVHTVTIKATDQTGNTSTVSQQITVVGPPTVSIQSVSPSASVNVGQTVYFGTAVTGFTNPVYSVSDSLISSSLVAGNINSAGNFSWTPRTQDVGGHTITVYVSDSMGHTATASTGISIGATATATITSLLPGPTVVSGQTVSFTIVPTGFTNPTYTVSDSLFGSSINANNINSSGLFTWTPRLSDTGLHTITIYVTDTTGDSATISQQINVSTASVSIQSVSPGNIVLVGTPITFTATSTGFFNPVYSVSDTLSGSTISSANINQSGIFIWTPRINDIGSHSISTTVIDGAGHSASTYTVVQVTSSAGTVTTTNTQASTNSSYIFTNNLSLGSTGTDVTALQNLLTKNGLYSGPITGTIGSLTISAIKKFQTAHNISAIGIVGPATRVALNNVSPLNISPLPATTNDGYRFNNPLALGSTGTDVTELQKRLTTEGVYTGPITGTFGPLTEAAVQKYQSQHGLSQLGNVGPGTRAALNGK